MKLPEFVKGKEGMWPHGRQSPKMGGVRFCPTSTRLTGREMWHQKKKAASGLLMLRGSKKNHNQQECWHNRPCQGNAGGKSPAMGQCWDRNRLERHNQLRHPRGVKSLCFHDGELLLSIEKVKLTKSHFLICRCSILHTGKIPTSNAQASFDCHIGVNSWIIELSLWFAT